MLKTAFPETYRYWKKNPRRILGSIAAHIGLILGLVAALTLVEVLFRPMEMPGAPELRSWLETTAGPNAGWLAPVITIAGATLAVGLLVLVIGFVVQLIYPKASIPDPSYIHLPHSTSDGSADGGAD